MMRYPDEYEIDGLFVKLGHEALFELDIRPDEFGLFLRYIEQGLNENYALPPNKKFFVIFEASNIPKYDYEENILLTLYWDIVEKDFYILGKDYPKQVNTVKLLTSPEYIFMQEMGK